jgi:hypothetical protein
VLFDLVWWRLSLKKPNVQGSLGSLPQELSRTTPDFLQWNLEIDKEKASIA